MVILLKLLHLKWLVLLRILKELKRKMVLSFSRVFPKKPKPKGKSAMKQEVAVAEIFKVIQEQPEQLFEMIRLDVIELSFCSNHLLSKRNHPVIPPKRGIIYKGKKQTILFSP